LKDTIESAGNKWVGKTPQEILREKNKQRELNQDDDLMSKVQNAIQDAVSAVNQMTDKRLEDKRGSTRYVDEDNEEDLNLNLDDDEDWMKKSNPNGMNLEEGPSEIYEEEVEA